MASALVYFGRGISIALCMAQSVALAQFAIIYESNQYYWFLVAMYIPAVVVLLNWFAQDCHLCHLWRAWLLYVFILNITAGVVFGLVAHQLSEDRVFGPQLFEISLCISPVLLFLLLNLASNSGVQRQLVILVSTRITLDLFDGVEMLDITLEKTDKPHDDVPQEMRIVIYILILVVFFLSAFELQNVEDHGHERRTPVCIRTVVHLVIDGAFLIFRLFLWIKFDRPAPNFTAKSGISIMVGIIELVEC